MLHWIKKIFNQICIIHIQEVKCSWKFENLVIVIIEIIILALIICSAIFLCKKISLRNKKLEIIKGLIDEAKDSGNENERFNLLIDALEEI